MSKPTLENCPHCGGEISFRVFADKRRKHSRYVLSVKCEMCKTVTTICTKERGGAAFAALAEKWNARAGEYEYAPGGFVVEHVNRRCALNVEKLQEEPEPEYVNLDGHRLKRCSICGGKCLDFDIRSAFIYAAGIFREDGWSSRVVCDCGAVSNPYVEGNMPKLARYDVERMKRNAATLWNVEGAQI